MAKKSLLLVDADPRSLRVLEVSLRKAGYSVATCGDAQEAISTVDLSPPDLILSDTRLPGLNGFQLVEELRRKDEHKTIPFMFLSSESSVESKVRGLELGVEDYLTKPIYIKEIITRINLTLQRQEREGLARKTSVAKTRFTGSLGDMGLVDLLQTVEISRKSGVLELSNGAHRGAVTFRDGQLLDAEAGKLHGDSAIYRLLLWNEGEFEIDFRPVRAEQRIKSSTQALLMEGMRRIDEWGRLLEQIPSLDNVFDVSEDELVERLAEIPDEINEILRHIDGKRSLIEVVDSCDGDDLETLTAITKLYFEGIIYPTGRTAGDEEDRILDEEVVPAAEHEAADGSAEGVPPQMEDGFDEQAGEIALVPRAVSEPPPPPPRASANTGPSIDSVVSERADLIVPKPAQLPDERQGGVPGMDPALPPSDFALALEAGARRADKVSETKVQTGEPPPKLPEVPENEDGMQKKGRRRRKLREKTAKETTTQLEQREAANNVIQFAAHAKRAVGASHVAVNDIGVAPESAPPAPPQNPEESARMEEAATLLDVEPIAVSPPPVPPAAFTMPQPPKPPPPPPRQSATEKLAVRPPPPPAPAEQKHPAEPEAPMFGGAKTIVEERPSFTQPAPTPAFTPPNVPAKPLVDERPAFTKPLVDPAPAFTQPAAQGPKVGSITGELVSITGEHQAVAEDFFRSTPQPAQETWDDLKKEALPPAPGMRIAKYATFAIFLLGLFVIGGYWIYTNVWMPRPVELSGATRPPELPDGFAAEQTRPQPPQQQAAQPEAPPEQPPQPVAEVAPPVEGQPVEGQPAEGQQPAQVQPPPEVPPVAPAAPGGYAELLAQANELRRRRPAEAITAYEAAIAANPNGAEALAELSFLLLNRARNRAQYQTAADLAQRAVTADGTSALGWLVLGAARQSMGDDAGGRAAYQSCVAQGTDRRYVGECRQML